MTVNKIDLKKLEIRQLPNGKFIIFCPIRQKDIGGVYISREEARTELKYMH